MSSLHQSAFLLLLASTLAAHPAGRQLTGPHAPASSRPLPPAEAEQQFKAPPGFQVRLFAAEPDVVNPVAMSWDDRGRLWVLELFEYPTGATPGAQPRDRIRILEDTDNDGRADKVTLFADSLNLATGLLYGDGGVYVGQAPHLLFLKDTNGDDVADQRTVLLTGFGLEDRHELLNGFAWGPDGWLYMTHGVFTHSKVKAPGDENKDLPGVTLNAGLARFHPRTREFEVFADGTSNPWGVDFDRYGNAFVSACVIDHLFHLSPGAHYVRQAGQPEHRHGYGLLPSIVDHKHYRAAYAGVQVYQGSQYPEEYLGRIFMGNIHGNAINQDQITPHGSSFKASALENFVRTGDGWFRPVSQQVGPDGALWIMDWYDKYPCYQNANADPEGVDRQHGRIWRVVHTRNDPGRNVPSRSSELDAARDNTSRLVQCLAHPNVWTRRQAQRLLSERRDPNARIMLLSLMQNGPTLESRLAALWTLHTSGQLGEDQLDSLVTNPDFALRMWTARLTGERRSDASQALARLQTLAADPSAPVRSAVATALRQYVSGSLTVNTPVPENLTRLPVGEALAPLIQASADGKDPVIPFLVWLTVERLLQTDPVSPLSWLLDHAGPNMPLGGELIGKSMQRLSDSGDPAQLALTLEFIRRSLRRDPVVTIAALDGLLQAQQRNATKPTEPTEPFFETLLQNPDAGILARAHRLGALWGDTNSIDAIEQLLRDESTDPERRLQALQLARQIKTDPIRNAILAIVERPASPALLNAAISSLNTLGSDQLSQTLITRWKDLPESVRRNAAEVLISRPGTLVELLAAVEAGRIAPGDIPVTVVRTLSQHKDQPIREHAARVIGRFREPDANIEQLIARKRTVALTGTPDLEAGRKLAETTCLVCHKFHGTGAEVGPDLTGSGRSTLDALLANIINPNQIIGAGYENVTVDTTDNRSIGGRLIEQNDNYVKLLASGPIEHVIARKEIAELTVSDLSVMPEGLEQLPDAGFRDLVWFILNPPEDNRPMTPTLRRELIGDAPDKPVVDWESVSLWNPDWQVRSEEQGGAPSKLTGINGRHNVLLTHPFRHQQGASLDRTVELPAGGTPRLTVEVAARDNGRWVLRIFVKAQLVHQELIEGSTWKPISIDLSAFAGQTVGLRLENYAYDLQNDYALWHNLNLK